MSTEIVALTRTLVQHIAGLGARRILIGPLSIEERLARLERENRRLKAAGLLVLLVAASVFLMAQVRPIPTVEAQEFIVRTADGKRVMRLAAGPEGQPSLTFFDQQDEAGIFMYLNDRGTSSISSMEALFYDEEEAAQIAEERTRR